MKKYILLLTLIPALTLASITSDLRFGMKSNQVTELQAFLIEKGYISKDSKTGFFGYKTLTGVKRYQADSKLPSTGFVGRLTRYSINSSTTVNIIVPTSTVETVIATTTEPFILQNAQPVVAEATPKVYNIIIMEEETPTYTLGTPITVTKTNGDGDTYSYVNLPISFNPNIVTVGNTVVIEGTITNGTSTQSAGNEFAFAPTSPVNTVMNLGDVNGTFAFTFTLKNNKGTVLYTQDDSVVIQ